MPRKSTGPSASELGIVSRKIVSGSTTFNNGTNDLMTVVTDSDGYMTFTCTSETFDLNDAQLRSLRSLISSSLNSRK